MKAPAGATSIEYIAFEFVGLSSMPLSAYQKIAKGRAVLKVNGVEWRSLPLLYFEILSGPLSCYFKHETEMPVKPGQDVTLEYTADEGIQLPSDRALTINAVISFKGVLELSTGPTVFE